MRASILFHEGELQGAGVAVMRTLPGLRDAGWEPRAWFPHEGPLLAAIDPLVDELRFRQGTFAFSPRGWRLPPGPVRRAANLPGYFKDLRAWLRATAPDVVHANTLLSVPEATVAHRLGLPVVLHMHELPPPGAKTTLTLKWVAAVSDVVVTVSDAVAELFAPYATSTETVRVYNGLAPEAFAPAGAAAASADGRVVVGTIGATTSRKGADVFFDAAAQVIAARGDVDVLHVGPPAWESDAFRAAIDARVGALPADRVTIAGVQPSAPLLETMDIFVMASRQDPFPLAGLEAMAAGKALIVTDVGGLPEQVVHLESGIVVAPDDAGAIASWVQRLADEPQLRARLGAAAQARAAEHFGLDQQVAGLDAAYRRAVALRA